MHAALKDPEKINTVSVRLVRPAADSVAPAGVQKYRRIPAQRVRRNRVQCGAGSYETDTVQGDCAALGSSPADLLS